MPFYVELAEIAGRIPPSFLTQALDDDADGVADAWELVQAAACRAVDALLGLRFTVPLAQPWPAIVTEAAAAWACYECYRRRSVPDDTNPQKGEFDRYFDASRGLLVKIANNTLPLQPGVAPATSAARLIKEPAGTFDCGGRLMS